MAKQNETQQQQQQPQKQSQPQTQRATSGSAPPGDASAAKPMGGSKESAQPIPTTSEVPRAAQRFSTPAASSRRGS